MDRRTALSAVGTVLGGVIVGSEAFLAGCGRSSKEVLTGDVLSEDQVQLLNAIADVIIPESAEGPGAGQLKVGAFMNDIVTDCYTPDEQNFFKTGLTLFEDLCRDRFGQSFAELTMEDRSTLISIMEDESSVQSGSDEVPHFYHMIKQLTVWGYLSSEHVSTKVLRYTPVPGRYEGCIPYQRGEKAFS